MGVEEQTRGGYLAWKRWAFALVPAVGLLELLAHFVQTCSVVPDRDWRAARDYVSSASRAEDLVAFAPRWADPVGREHFGPSLATVAREARADETRFARAFEVSIRGSHLASLADWRRTEQHRFGSVVVTTLENPTPAPVLDDLVSHVDPSELRVSRVQGDHETDCPFGQGGVQSGPLGFGPAVPSSRFVCPTGGFVGASVAADMDYTPRRCIYAPPQGGNSVTRLRFLGVHMGRSLRGHHALYVESERHRVGTPVTIRFRTDESTIGEAVHRDGTGWRGFEFDTTALAGSSRDLIVEIATANADQRKYCFEATTR